MNGIIGAPQTRIKIPSERVEYCIGHVLKSKTIPIRYKRGLVYGWFFFHSRSCIIIVRWKVLRRDGPPTTWIHQWNAITAHTQKNVSRFMAYSVHNTSSFRNIVKSNRIHDMREFYFQFLWPFAHSIDFLIHSLYWVSEFVFFGMFSLFYA